jgi:hypothetical protein
MPSRDIRVIKKGAAIYGFGVVRTHTTEQHMKLHMGMKQSEIDEYFRSTPSGSVRASVSSSIPFGISETFLEQPVITFGEHTSELVIGVEFKAQKNLLLLDIGRANEEKLKNFRRIIEEGLEEVQRTRKGMLKCFHGIMFYRSEGYGNYECILFGPHRVLERVREVPMRKPPSKQVDPMREVMLVIDSSLGYFGVESLGEKEGETFKIVIKDQELRRDDQ